MQVHYSLTEQNLGTIPENARTAEAIGYDGLWLIEGTHNPFFSLLLAAEHTSKMRLSTGLAIAFARNPMTVASTAYDLQAYSRGRFTLGLGSQIKAHIERRYSMPWSHPADRMREFVLALRAIWDAWSHGSQLNFQGTYYTHTLLPPAFNPGPNPYGNPAVMLGGVGERMVETAGEVADAFLCHSFNTAKYLRTVTLPALQRGLSTAGRSLNDFEINSQLLAVTGNTEEEMNRARERARQDIAFYGSTPAYGRVLELHGWSDVHTKLHQLSREGKWNEMTLLINDEMLETIAIVGEPQEIGRIVKKRYGDVYRSVYLYTHVQPHPDLWTQVREGFKN